MARGHGEGTIYVQVRNGRKLYVAQLCVGRDPETRKLIRKTVYGSTRKEVAQKLDELKRALSAGLPIDPPKLTVAEYLDRWLADAAAHTVRPTTLESYARYCRVHIKPALGALQLSQLTPLHIQQFYSAKLSQGLSRRTVQYMHAILHRALEQAVKWQLLARNPADAVDAPRPARQSVRVLTPDQIRQLVEAMADDRLAPLYYLAIATGARRGELVALRWSDVDLERGEIHISRTAEEIMGDPDERGVRRRVIFTEPKTDRSRRRIPLPAEAVAMLKAHRRRQAEEKLRAGPAYQDHGLVFAREDGTPLSPNQVSHHFAIILKRAGLPQIRLHDLRHTHATLLLAAGVHIKLVSERLGHSTITLTGDLYSHVLPTMQDEVARTLDKLLPAHKPDAK